MALTPAEYQVLVEQAPIMVWRADATGACDWFNGRWLEFKGRSLEEEQGLGWTRGVHPEDLPRFLASYRESFAARRGFEMEYRLRRFDGRWRWILDRGVPVHEHGVFRGFIGSCVDVTERVEAERALASSRAAEIARLEALLPICAHCGHVRDDAGYWHHVEAFLQESGTARLTHTLCPGCLERHYPE